MFKPTPTIVGTVTSNAPPSATVLSVSNTYWQYLLDVLSAGDWTYAKARLGNTAEIVKITGVSMSVANVTVERGTHPIPMVAGQELEFVVGAAAVQDMLDAQALAPSITITGGGGVLVDRTGNDFTVYSPYFSVSSSDGSVIVSEGQDEGSYDVSVNTSTIGCCNSSGGGGDGGGGGEY